MTEEEEITFKILDILDMKTDKVIIIRDLFTYLQTVPQFLIAHPDIAKRVQNKVDKFKRSPLSEPIISTIFDMNKFLNYIKFNIINFDEDDGSPF